MEKAYIVIGSGALNIILENGLHEELKGPFYVLLSHESEAMLERAQKLTAFGGQVLFIVDAEQPYRRLSKRQQEQLVYLYEQELLEITSKHEAFVLIGGAAGQFSGNVLAFCMKLLFEQRKGLEVMTWLATPFEGKRFDGQIEQILHYTNRNRIKATIIQPTIDEEQRMTYLEQLNGQIADQIRKQYK